MRAIDADGVRRSFSSQCPGRKQENQPVQSHVVVCQRRHTRTRPRDGANSGRVPVAGNASWPLPIRRSTFRQLGANVGQGRPATRIRQGPFRVSRWKSLDRIFIECHQSAKEWRSGHVYAARGVPSRRSTIDRRGPTWRPMGRWRVGI